MAANKILNCSCIDSEYRALLRATIMHEELRVGGELEDAKRELERVRGPGATEQEKLNRSLNEYLVRIYPGRLSMLRTLSNIVDAMESC